jgi:Uncharacterized protein conserved in bacteria (DUF2058)
MGDLRDQLKKAKLLSKKDARRLAHEDRVHHKSVGGAAGLDGERAAHQAELRAQKDAQRQADRTQQSAVQAQRDASAEVLACQELLRREVIRSGRKGATRWYFELESGELPFLELPVAERMQLADGSLCVVRTGPRGTHDYGLMRTDHARRVAMVFPERVVHGDPA